MSEDEPIPDGYEGSNSETGDSKSTYQTPAGEATSTFEPGVSSKSPRRWVAVGIVATLIVIAGVVGFLVVGSEAAAILSAGSGKATVTWTPVPNGGNAAASPPQPFSGTISGHSVSGLSTSAIPTGSGPSNINPTLSHGLVHVFTWRGTFGGKPFDLGMFIRYPVSVAESTGSFVARGTYEGESVNAVVGPPKPNVSDESNPPIPFHGTIGRWKVTGIISGPTGTPHRQTATATFTVSS